MRRPRITVKNGYDKIAETYLASRTTDSEDVRLLDELIRRLPQGAAVLDAGCGAGVPIARILARSFSVTGVDFSESQIALARRLVPDAEFLCQDMTDLSLTDASFDAVCSYYAIIHIPRDLHESILRQFHRLLRPGGLALLCLGAEDLPEDRVEDYLGAPMFWSHFDAATNLRLLARCGFEVEWSRIVSDATCPGPGHLFVLARKP